MQHTPQRLHGAPCGGLRAKSARLTRPIGLGRAMACGRRLGSGRARQRNRFCFTGEMSVVARERARADRRETATWSFRPSCEWMSRRSLPNKMSLEVAVGFG